MYYLDSPQMIAMTLQVTDKSGFRGERFVTSSIMRQGAGGASTVDKVREVSMLVPEMIGGEFLLLFPVHGPLLSAKGEPSSFYEHYTFIMLIKSAIIKSIYGL